MFTPILTPKIIRRKIGKFVAPYRKYKLGIGLILFTLSRQESIQIEKYFDSVGDCEDLINHFVIISHRDWTPDFRQFISSRRVTRARHASNCRILLDHQWPLIWPYDDQKLEFYLDEVRTKIRKFERQDMSSLGIFQNGNGSIFEIFQLLKVNCSGRLDFLFGGYFSCDP